MITKYLFIPMVYNIICSLTFRNDDNWYNTSLTDMLSDNEGFLIGTLLLFFISATFYNSVTCILIHNT